MENVNWRIDCKPTEKLEDGEISESDNESNLKLNETTNETVNCLNTTLLNDSFVSINGEKSNKSSNESIDKQANKLPVKQSIRSTNKKDKQKKLIKNKLDPKFDHYYKMSEAELESQLRLVYHKIQSIESKDQQNLTDNHQQIDNQQIVNQQMNNQSNEQINLQMNPQINPNFVQNVQFDQQMNKQLKSTNSKSSFKNMKVTKKFNKSNHLAINDEMSLSEIKKMFNELKKIIIINSKSKNKKFNSNKKFNQNKNNKNANFQNSNANKKRKLKNKNNSNKRMKVNAKLANPNVTPNCQLNISANSNQSNLQPTTSSFNAPVITSDLFSATNQFDKNLNFKGNKKRKQSTNKSPSSNSQICKYFKFGSCNKGDKCEFIHTMDNSMKIYELCKFYVQNACDKGSNCPYLHNEFPCKFYHTGAVCHEAENCKFSHKELTEEMSLVLKQYLNPKDKLELFKKDKVLLGEPTFQMKNSHETWKWQQEFLKLETECTGEDKEAFKISTKFIISDEPLLTSKKKFYTQDDDDASEENSLLNMIKQENTEIVDKMKEEDVFKDNESINQDNLNEEETINQKLRQTSLRSTENNQSNNIYQRRSDLLKNKENEMSSKTDLYLDKIEKIISGNKMSKSLKLAVDQKETPNFGNINRKTSSSSINANLYKPRRESDNSLSSLSDLINKLADETKVDNLTGESTNQLKEFNDNKAQNLIGEILNADHLMNQKYCHSTIEQFDNSTVQKSVDHSVEQNIEHSSNQIKDNAIINRGRSLIDEIMNSKGYVASSSLTGLIDSTKLTHTMSSINHPTQTSSLNKPFDLNSIYQSNPNNSSALRSTTESDLLNITNLHPKESKNMNLTNLQFCNSHEKFMNNTQSNFSPSFNRTNSKDYIISESILDNTRFKLHLIDKVQATYDEYENYQRKSSNVDPRLKVISSKCNSLNAQLINTNLSTNSPTNLKNKIDSSFFEQLTNSLSAKDKQKDVFSLSGLCELKRNKIDP